MKKKLLFSILFMAITFTCMLGQEVAGSLDERFFYTFAEAQSWLSSLTVDRRMAYLRTELFDLVFLSSYSYAAWIVLQKRWALLPGTLDLIETASILLYLLQVTELLPFLGYVTLMKWVSGGVLMILTLTKLRTFKK